MAETIDIGVKIKTEAAKSALAGLNTFSKSEIAAMTSSFEKGSNAQAAAAKKAADTAAKEWNKGVDSITKKIASKFGPAVADLVDIGGAAGGVLGGLGTAALGAAAGLAAAGAAVLGGAYALNSLIDSADPALARLKQIEGAGAIDPTATAALDNYRQASLGVEAAALGLQVQVASLAADAFEPAASALGGLLNRMDEALPSAQALAVGIGEVQAVGRAGAAIFSLGTSELLAYALGLDSLDEEGRDAASTLRDLTAAQEGLNARMNASKAIVQIQKEAMIAMTGANSAQVALANSTDALDLALSDYVATLDMADPAQQGLANAAAHSVEVRKEQIIADTEAAEAARKAAEAARFGAQAERELAESVKARDLIRATANETERNQEQERIDRDKAAASRMEAELAASEDFLNRKAQFELDASNASIALAEAEAERKKAAIKMALGAVEAATQATIGLGVAALDQQIANAEGGSKAEQEAAMKAWKLRQALAITNAGIDGVSAYMGLLAGFAPLLWGAPIAAAAIAVPATATAVSQIASAPAPTFPDGGMVRRPRMASDHFPIGVEEGEGVANRRGIRNNPGVLDAMNSGARVGGGSVSIVNRYRHREFNAVTKDNLKMSSPLSRKLDGLSPPGRRR